jgi:glycosyltransferase involved in cell wall biosynthesis
MEQPDKRDYSGALNFVFTGGLFEGKRPLLAIQIVEALYKEGLKVNLEIFGEGVLKANLMDYIQDNKLENLVILHGNQPKETIKKALKKAHFSMLPSKSEGWPKAIAEAMFFGAIPIATAVSCLPYMLDYGNRGILIKGDLIPDLDIIKNILNDKEKLQSLSQNATKWSQLYTLDRFESEILKLL